MKSEEKEVYVKAIARLQIQDRSSEGILLFQKKYQPAMKFLEKFSHAILFYGYEERLCHTVAQIVEVSMKEGVVKLHMPEGCLESEAVIYDVKPYFPCEDHVVMELVEEKASEEKKEQMQEVPFQQITKLLPVTRMDEKLCHEFHEDERASLKAMKTSGRICVQEGRTYVLMNQGEEFEVGDYIRIVWWFDRFDQPKYRNHFTCKPPYENAPTTGVFASRSPVRPNPIAFTTAQVISVVDRNRIQITDIDAYDGTFILQVIPYRFSFESIEAAYVPEWLSHWPNSYQQPTSSLEQESQLDEPIERQLSRRFLRRDTSKIEEAFTWNPKPKEASMDCITIHGARQNNLKNLSVRIPYHKMIAVTGVSGGGKTSLVFDTIYAESQRRFFANMNVAGMEQIRKPDVDSITGLPPAIAISQTETANQPRSTVGTYTDLYDLLCKIYATIGIRHCPRCNKELIIRSEGEILQLMNSLSEVSPISYRPFGQEGWRSNAKISKEELHIRLDEGKGAIEVRIEELQFLLQTRQKCYRCNHVLFELTPSSFKFNQPDSMCPHCKGLGEVYEVSMSKVITDETLSLLDGASPWWKDLRKFIKQPSGNWMKGEVIALAKAMQVDLELPWNQLPEDFREKALYGTGKEEVRWEASSSNGRSGVIVRPVTGAINHIKRLYYDNDAKAAKTTAVEYMKPRICPTCQGERLLREARLVTVGGKRLPEIVDRSIKQLSLWLKGLPEQLEPREMALVKEPLIELIQRMDDFNRVGLSHLTLNRSLPTLSGGEFARLRFISQLRNGLSNLLYIFDEPSKGLHPNDYDLLIHLMEELRQQGNTILIVEHARRFMVQSEYFLEVGPGSSRDGGQIVIEGRTKEILEDKQAIASSTTLQYLTKQQSLARHQMPVNEEAVRNKVQQGNGINIEGINYHNLHDVTVQLPLGSMTCITGVSGSGKSSLLQILLDALTQNDNTKSNTDSLMSWTKLVSPMNLSVEYVNQKPIGKTSRSTPATYSGLLDCLRNLYAMTDAAQVAHLTPQHFSYNTSVGQCDNCKGTGEINLFSQVSTRFHAVCPVCHGRRYSSEVLQIRYHEKTIADVLSLSAQDAFAWAKSVADEESDLKKRRELDKIMELCGRFISIGLGYLILFQSSNEISGGEAQRMKLMNHLEERAKKTIFLLDEPTTGLHYKDIQTLLEVFDQLIQRGNTIVMIEHNPEVIALADYIIDLGPSAGADGGQVVAYGSVDEICQNPNSITGKYLV